VILEKRTEADYGYGGYTGTDTEYTEILGYVLTEEKAQEKVAELTQADRERKGKRRGLVVSRYYEYEIALQL
jgi:hypothetical protein